MTNLTIERLEAALDGAKLLHAQYSAAGKETVFLETITSALTHLITAQKPDVEAGDVLERTDELLNRIEIQCNSVGHPVGGISELKLLFRRALTANKPNVPEGWKLVPIEPTNGMLISISDEMINQDNNGGIDSPVELYKAMIAAVPETK